MIIYDMIYQLAVMVACVGVIAATSWRGGFSGGLRLTAITVGAIMLISISDKAEASDWKAFVKDDPMTDSRHYGLSSPIESDDGIFDNGFITFVCMDSGTRGFKIEFPGIHFSLKSRDTLMVRTPPDPYFTLLVDRNHSAVVYLHTGTMETFGEFVRQFGDHEKVLFRIREPRSKDINVELDTGIEFRLWLQRFFDACRSFEERG